MIRFFISFLLLISLLGCHHPQPKLSALAAAPHWSALEVYQETITREDFLKLLQTVYAQDQDYQKYITVFPRWALIRKNDSDPKDFFKLRFAADRSGVKSVSHTESATRKVSGGLPLAGLKIALDPGHLGGEWARMEGRWFQMEFQPPILEGDLTLQVAKRLERRLQELGAEVYLVRQNSDPLTPWRPESLMPLADEYLQKDSSLVREEFSGRDGETASEKAKRLSELLFYRTAEIRARAQKINQSFKPDLTLCLHFDAENWGDPKNPQSAVRNHFHVLMNGAYTGEELSFDDIRREMLLKLLSGVGEVEEGVAEKVAEAFLRNTGLPPAFFPAGSVKKVGTNPYVWARNLLANRIYEGPVIYLEPYVMNHPEVMARIQEGDYEGVRRVGDRWVTSLYEEYAASVAEGLVEYYRSPPQKTE
ncbi:MAG: N-acetylmuramoyl-L-alanine amidase [bacterium]